MNIHGMGVVFSGGRGIPRLRETLRSGWQPPPRIEVPFQADPYPAYTVSAETLTDKALLQAIRRADRFTKMAVLAGADALADASSAPPDRARIGIILATAFGPHATTFRFLDDILDYGDAGVSPTTFSHAVHNAAASYLATVLGVRGPTLTVTLFSFPFHETLRLADAWLAEGRCDYVLAGAVDECGVAMEYIVREKLSLATDGMIRPFQFASTPGTVPGEGGVFMLLSRREEPSYARVEAAVTSRPSPPPPADLLLLEADGMLPDETPYRECVAGAVAVAAYAPLFGGLMAGSAFSAAAGALMLTSQTRFATPVPDNPHGIPLCSESGPAALRRIVSVKRDCQKRQGMISLSRP